LEAASVPLTSSAFAAQPPQVFEPIHVPLTGDARQHFEVTGLLRSSRRTGREAVDGVVAGVSLEPTRPDVAHRLGIAVSPGPAKEGGQRVGVEPLNGLPHAPFVPLRRPLPWPRGSDRRRQDIDEKRLPFAHFPRHGQLVTVAGFGNDGGSAGTSGAPEQGRTIRMHGSLRGFKGAAARR
jgi:hypothetical protein